MALDVPIAHRKSEPEARDRHPANAERLAVTPVVLSDGRQKGPRQVVRGGDQRG
jgi:hypothetical protein